MSNENIRVYILREWDDFGEDVTLGVFSSREALEKAATKAGIDITRGCGIDEFELDVFDGEIL